MIFRNITWPMEHVTVKEQRSSKKKHGLGTPKSKGDLCAVFGSKNDRWSLEKYVLNFTLIFRNLPWVPETFLARFPVSVKSLSYGRRCVGLRPTPKIPTAREKNLWYPAYQEPGSHYNRQRNHRKVTFLHQKLFWASQNKSNQSNEFIQHGFGVGEKVS